jgi:phenylpropionate dioxygenase-like ring-hydroxylating dioxygenase large terminal subunit
VSVSDEPRQRHTLPARAYVERAVYEAELDHVFARSWIFACPERVVAAPGSVATANVAGEPVAIVRGDDGVLRAL